VPDGFLDDADRFLGQRSSMARKRAGAFCVLGPTANLPRRAHDSVGLNAVPKRANPSSSMRLCLEDIRRPIPKKNPFRRAHHQMRAFISAHGDLRPVEMAAGKNDGVADFEFNIHRGNGGPDGLRTFVIVIRRAEQGTWSPSFGASLVPGVGGASSSGLTWREPAESA